MAKGVNFTPAAARRISNVVREVENRPYPEKSLQRRRAGGLGRSTLWEVTAIQTGPKTVTIRRVENQDGDLIAPSEKINILYDPDNVPAVEDRGLLIRLGNGSLFFFRREADVSQIHRVTWAGWSQVREATPDGTFEVNQAATTSFYQAGVAQKRIVVVEFDEPTGLSVPNGGKVWLQVGMPHWGISANDITAGAKSVESECNVWFIKEAFDYTTITYNIYTGLAKIQVSQWVSGYHSPGGGDNGAQPSSGGTPNWDQLALAMFLLPGDKIFSGDTYYGFAVELDITAFAGCVNPTSGLQFYPGNYHTRGGSNMDVIDSVSEMIDNPGGYRGEPC